MKRVPWRFGIGGAGTETVTLNEHTADRPRPSIALHDTAVVPDGNELFGAAVHVLLTGGVPPLTTGLANATGMDVTVYDEVVTATLDGQVIDGAVTGWQSVQGGGVIGVSWHPAAAATSRNTNSALRTTF